MQDILPGRTARETRLSADRGKAAAQAISHRLYAEYLYAHAAEDMKLLGLTVIPDPQPQKWPVTGGTDEDRKARVDAWAAAHHVKAATDEASGTYRAVLGFGPVSLTVYMIPERTAGEQLAALYRAARGEAA